MAIFSNKGKSIGGSKTIRRSSFSKFRRPNSTTSIIKPIIKRQGFRVKICVRPPNVPIVFNCLRDRKKYGPRPVENNDHAMEVEDDDNGGDQVTVTSYAEVFDRISTGIPTVPPGTGVSPGIPTGIPTTTPQPMVLDRTVDTTATTQNSGGGGTLATPRRNTAATPSTSTNETYAEAFDRFRGAAVLDNSVPPQLASVVSHNHPHRVNSSAKLPPTQRTCENAFTKPPPSGRIQRYDNIDTTVIQVTAPPGPLRFELQNLNEVATISIIKDDCPVKNKIQIGDELIGIDDVYFRGQSYSFPEVIELVKSKGKNRVRTLIFIRLLPTVANANGDEVVPTNIAHNNDDDTEEDRLARSATVGDAALAAALAAEEDRLARSATSVAVGVPSAGIGDAASAAAFERYLERVAADIEDRRPKKFLIRDFPNIILNERQQKMADLGLSLEMVRRARSIIPGERTSWSSPRAAAFRLIKKHIQVLLNCDLNTLTVGEALQNAIAFRKDLVAHFLIFAAHLRGRLNLGSFPDPDIFGIIIMNWCTPKCIDFVDPKETDPATQANHTADTNACIRFVKYTLPAFYLRQAHSQRLEKIEDGALKKVEVERLTTKLAILEKEIPQKIGVVDRLWMVPYTKKSYLKEINQMTAEAGFDTDLAPYVAPMLVAFQSVLSTAKHKRSTPSLYLGGDVRSNIRGTVPPRSENAPVFDAGSIPHPENFVVRSRLMNQYNYPTQKVELYDELFTKFYSNHIAFKEFISGERLNCLFRYAGLGGDGDAFTATEFAEMRSLHVLFGDKNMSDKQYKALYDPNYRATFVRLYGDKDMSEAQRKGQFSVDGQDLTEKQQKAINDHKHAKPIRGQHATDREQMGFSKTKMKPCYICQYIMFMEPKFRDEADAKYKIYHQTNPPRKNVDGTDNKDYVSPSKYALRSTYSNDQNMIKNSKGGCNECNIWVCEDHWTNFVHNQAHKYVQFVSTRPNYSDFGKPLYYAGHCETCGHDMYTGIQYAEQNQKCKTCSGPRNSRPFMNKNIPSKLGELYSEQKSKKCKCKKDCECTE